jgi:hypothetical protein
MIVFVLLVHAVFVQLVVITHSSAITDFCPSAACAFRYFFSNWFVLHSPRMISAVALFFLCNIQKQLVPMQHILASRQRVWFCAAKKMV